MRNTTASRTAEYDDPRLYARASGLRQRQDAAWVLECLPPGSFQGCLDLGCGNGDFLALMLLSGRITGPVTALDRSQAMVEAAQRSLAPLMNGQGLCLHVADILAPPPLAERFPLVTMLAVQHWLYPREDDAYRWIVSRLEDGGVFCLTTYHPETGGGKVGGSDEVILEALEMIGLPARFPPDFIPMGERARPPHAVRALLEKRFTISAVHHRVAETRAESARQFSDYHRATFGNYFAGLVPEPLRAAFHEAVGRAAMRRMEQRGFVTRMAVHCWICRKQPAV